MKKVFSILIISFVLFSCRQRIAISPEEFQSLMKQNDFSVYPLEIHDEELALEDYWCAKNRHFQIEYLRFHSNREATSFFNQRKKDFLQWKGEVALVEKQNKKGFTFYSQNNFVTYGVISCVENTLIYCKNKSQFSQEVDSLLTQIGY